MDIYKIKNKANNTWLKIIDDVPKWVDSKKEASSMTMKSNTTLTDAKKILKGMLVDTDINVDTMIEIVKVS